MSTTEPTSATVGDVLEPDEERELVEAGEAVRRATQHRNETIHKIAGRPGRSLRAIARAVGLTHRAVAQIIVRLTSKPE